MITITNLFVQLDHPQVVVGLEGGEEEDEEEHHGNHSATASDHKISKNTFINGLSPTQSYSQQSRPLPPLHKKTVFKIQTDYFFICCHHHAITSPCPKPPLKVGLLSSTLTCGKGWHRTRSFSKKSWLYTACTSHPKSSL